MSLEVRGRLRRFALLATTVAICGGTTTAQTGRPVTTKPATSKPATTVKPSASPSGRPAAGPSAKPSAKPAPAAQAQMVLGPTSFWRMYHVLKPPVVDVDGLLKPHLSRIVWLDEETPAAPTGWREPNFDDSAWLRTMARGGCQTCYLDRQCVRGKFLVTAPEQVRDLKITVVYHGGVVVYLNGKELTRQNVPPGEVTAATMADAYPLEAFVQPSGALLAGESTYIPGGRTGRPDAESAKRMAARDRALQDFAVPAAAVRKGVNVLAVELLRTPFHQVVGEAADKAGKQRSGAFDWYTCQLLDIRLAASAADGLATSAVRPAGLQVWNSDPAGPDGGLDYGDTCEPLRPIRIVSPRNGLMSGKVAVGSTKPIADLRATATELKGAGGSIPASAVHVRYGMPWGDEDGFCRGESTISGPYPQWPAYYGAVSDAPPAEANVVKPERAKELAGVVQPVWYAVKVPREAKPGAYEGQLKIEVRGEQPVIVPVRLEVSDFVTPDPQDQKTWVEMIQVPDTTAVEYKLPPWSEKHWAMIAQSFRLISPSGTRVVHLPAIAHTNLGNSESMIRWIEKGPRQYDWDFSIMDKYLDVACKELGTPKVIVLQAWELYMRSAMGKRFEDFKVLETPLVTMVNAKGEANLAALPKLDDPTSKETWKRLIGEVRKRLAARGLEKTLMLGMFTDATPSKEHIQFFHDIAPDLPWVQEGHGRWTEKIYGTAEIGYQATVWGGFRFGDGLVQTNQRGAPIVQSLMGWRNPRLDAVFERNTGLDSFPLTRWRFYAETGITSELRGVGRIGADYWKALRNREGRRAGWIHLRYPEGAWGGNGIQLNLCSSTLAPGPEGPLATTRLIEFCEGVQCCEARITIERALTNEAAQAKLGPDLAKKCQDLLDRRLRTMWRTLSNYQLGGPFFFGAGAWRWTAGIPGQRWFLSIGWQDQEKDLFDLAAQAQRVLEK